MVYPSVGKQIPPKDITSKTGDPLKESKDILKDKNNKQVCTSIGGLLNNKEMFRDKKGKQVRTHTEVVYTGKLSN